MKPFQNLYDSTRKDKDLIISHKSAIPDLIIWIKNLIKMSVMKELILQILIIFHVSDFFWDWTKKKMKKIKIIKKINQKWIKKNNKKNKN